jgi:hypothetical protein
VLFLRFGEQTAVHEVNKSDEFFSEQIDNSKNRKKSGGGEVAMIRIDPRKWVAGPKRGADLPAVVQPARLGIHNEGLKTK